jgi:hypothetical protein
MLHERNINPEDLMLIHMTDSPHDAVDFVSRYYKAEEENRQKLVKNDSGNVY